MHSHRRSRSRALIVIGVVAGVAATACHSDNNNTAPLLASAITVNVPSTGQSGTVGTKLATPIEVTVTDQSGTPVPNVSVTWLVTAGGGAVAAANTTTGADGIASNVWTLGTIAGNDSLQATIPSGTETAVGALALAGPGATLLKVSGDAQTVTSDSTSLPLVVELVDSFGNAVPTSTVNWSVQGTGTLSAIATGTDVNGMSQVTLVPSAPGSYLVTASSGVVSPVTFTATAN